MDQVEHQYILYGLFDTFVFYSVSLGNVQFRKGITLLEKYLKGPLLDVARVWNVDEAALKI